MSIFTDHRAKILLPLLVGAIALGIFIFQSNDNHAPRSIPQGVQSMTGVLLPTDISLTRRGTHILKMDDSPLFYVESSKINLRAFEGRRVAVRGIVHANVDPMDDPVLVAQSVSPTTDPRLRAWTMPLLGITVESPKEWTGVNEEEEELKFFLSTSAAPFIRIYGQKAEELPYIFKTATLKTSNRSLTVTPILVGSTRAIRLVDSRDDSQHVSFEHQTGIVTGTGAIKNIVTFTYTPPDGDDVALDEAFLAVVHSLVFSRAEQSGSKSSQGQSTSSKKSTASSAASTSGSASQTEGAPCGGPAGILCGPSEYCEVTDLQTNIGKCRKL